MLGTIYRLWVDSFLFTLLQRLFRPVRESLRRSRILSAVFAEGWLERTYRSSLLARLTEGSFALARRALAWLTRLIDAVDGSGLTRVARASVLAPLASFEGLFGLFLLVMFITPHKLWNNLYTVLAAAFFLLWYLALTAAGRRTYASPRLLGLGVPMLVLAMVLSIGFSAVPRDSVRVLLFFLAAFALCYVIAADFRTPDKLRRLLGFLYCALLLVSLYAIAQRALGLVKANSSFTDLELNKTMPGRVYATLDNPINLSEFVLLFMPLGVAFAVGSKRPFLRLVLSAGLLCPALAMVLTYARGGWLALVLAALVFLYGWNKRLLPAAVMVGLCAVPLLPGSILARLSTIGNVQDTSTLHRLDIWQGVLRLLGDHGRFFTGIGLGPESFRYYYPFYSRGIAKVGAYHAQQHYLELLVETGLLGLVSFLYMICKYLGRAGRALRTGPGETRLILLACVSSIAALAFVGLVEYIWFYQRILFAFFLLLGILLAAAGDPEEA